VRRLRGFAAAVFVIGCSGSTQERAASDPPVDEQTVLDLGRAYVTERAFRRSALERSLLDTDNTYADVRLEHYAVDGGWEDLPELVVETAPLAYRDGVRVEWEPKRVWPGRVAWTEVELLALGKAAFERWPSQPLPTVELALGERDDPALTQSLGLWRNSDGWLGGLVLARYASGATVLAATCATCHARVGDDGIVEHGPASDLNLDSDGSLGWGEGRVDVTSDGASDPVAIADLRATVHQRRLHWTGNLRNGLAALAVRTETLLITNSGELTRPPREIAFALALYVQALGGARREPLPTNEPGQGLFDAHCARCHEGAWGAGEWVSLDEVRGDPAAALSAERGTGGYRVSALRFVSSRTRLGHEGFASSLDAFFDSNRLERHDGHPFGLGLDDSERAALIEYLSTF
jgi:hypothetical protein